MTRRFLTPLSTDHVDFNLTNPSEWAEGRLWWDDEEGTLEIGHSASVIQSVGMEFYMPPVKNNSGEDIPNGSFVMATGAQGDRITIAKAVTDGSVDPEYMVGIATMNIVDGSETGLITTHGTVRDIDTSLWPVGTLLYPSSASAGALTASADASPAIATPIAIVLRQHAQTGRIYVRMTNAHKFGEEQDVKITSPQDGDTITYNATSGLWENSYSVNDFATLSGEETLTNKTLTSPTITDGVFEDTFTIGQQVFYEHGVRGFSVNENFDITGGTENFTGYHYTSGAGRDGVAFTLARTGQFTNGFGIHGTSSSNEFVIGGEQSNTDIVFKSSIGMPFDVSGGTEIFRISSDGNLTINNSFTLPNSDGTSGQTLVTDGNGSVSWQDSGTGSEALVIASGPTYPLSDLTDGQLFYNTSNGRTAVYFDSLWKEFAYVSDLPLDGGSYNTTVFDNSIDGGSPSDTVFVGAYDGGTP